MIRSMRRSITVAALAALMMNSPAQGQMEGPPLDAGPWVFDTFNQGPLKVSIMARGMDHPFGLVFLPGTATEEFPLGDMLFTERYIGRIRFYTEGQLLDEPVADMSEIFPMEQLFDIELHPDFEENRLIYFTYIKTGSHPDGGDDYWVTTALARARYEGEGHLTDFEDVYVADAWSDNLGGASSRLHFLEDGTLLFGVSHRIEREAPQSLESDIGKVLRLNDDGSIPDDNPFVDNEDAYPQIYTWGNRSVMDFATHPETGEVWELENGPQGGDEVNILEPGANYGWPLATFGRDYDGSRFGPVPWVEGTELPVVFWVPSITVAGMTFYTGDAFPEWQNDLFVTSMLVGRIPDTGHLQRITLNEQGELSREQLLNDLQQRIRYVVEGPDDFIYLLTDHSDGALLRLEPATEDEAALYSDSDTTLNVETGEELIVFEGQDCQSCHRTDNALLGPSYRDIAARYEPDDETVDDLADKIIEGGGGQWGDTPMNPHPGIDRDRAREMVREILSL